MGRVITFANEKGGVGKTSAVFDTAFGLASRGNKVLLIDMDPQTNLTKTCGTELNEGKTIFACINGIASFESTIVKVKDNLDLLPGSRKMQPQYFIGAEDIYILKEVIKYIYEYKSYDYIVIDVGPSPGTLLTMSLLASDYFVAVAPLAKYAYEGVVQMCADVNACKKHYNGFNARPLGILINHLSRRTNVGTVNYDKFTNLTDEFGAEIFNTQIPMSCKMDECKEFHLAVQEYSPKEKISQAYKSFVDELLNRIKVIEKGD